MALQPTPSNRKAGQQYDPELDTILRYWEYEARYTDTSPDGAKVSTLESTNRLELTPTDTAAQKVREWDVTAIQAELADVSVVEHINIDQIRFPPTLTGISTVISKANGDGSDATPSATMVSIIYFPGSGGASPTAQAQGSAAAMMDLIINIDENVFENVPAIVASVFVPDNTSRADVLVAAQTAAGLGTAILDWPQFKPKAHTLVVQSARVNVSVRASTRVEAGGTTSNGHESYEQGQGSSFDIDINLKGIRISPTIHGDITISGTTSDTATASATADASMPAVILLSGSHGPTPNSITTTKTAACSVTPTSLPHTNIAAIPTTGFYAKELQPGPSRFGMTPYRVVIVDATKFA